MTQENINENKIIKVDLIIGNPKPATNGWIYNISDDKWMEAINPIRSKTGKILSAYFVFEKGKKYLIKYDDSSWRNTREFFEIVILDEDGNLKVLASWSRVNGNFKFDENLEKHYIEFCAKSSNKNVVNFAKYLAEKL